MSVKLRNLLLLLLLSSLVSRLRAAARFDSCSGSSVRVVEAFESSRVGAAIFPCFAQNVLFKYRPTASILLTSYRAICVMIRLCFATSALNRVKNKEEISAVLNCYERFFSHLMALDAYKYYKLQEKASKETANNTALRELMFDVVKCFDFSKLENMKFSSDSGVAVFRWLMRRIL